MPARISRIIERDANFLSVSNGVSVDVGPVHVRGALRARHARVLWADGTLYVVAKRNGHVNRQTLETLEPQRPKVPSGFWRAESDAGMVSFSSKGCGG